MNEKELGNVSVPTDHAALLEFCEYLLDKHEGSLSLSYLGRSLRGRAIPMLTLGNEDAVDGYFYVGAHHAMEWLTSTVLLKFVDDLLCSSEAGGEEYGIIPSKTLSEKFICVVPMLNPDGVELEIHGASEDDPLRGRLIKMNGKDDFTHWQANGRGVDLNHNYDAGFYEYKRLESSLGVEGGARSKYSGLYPESEPEVGALCNYLRFNRNVKGCLTLHTQGEEIYCGSAASSLSASRPVAEKVASATGYRLGKPSGSALFGGMSDWVTSVLEIPSFTVECGSGENPLPTSDIPSIYRTLRELLFTFPEMF